VSILLREGTVGRGAPILHLMSMYKIESSEDGGKAPNGPNFLLIVGLFCAVIVLGFGVAFLMIPDFAKRIHLVHPDVHPTSQLVLAAHDGRAA